MEPIEKYTHSFILKIWCERTGKTGARSVWRGYITHVPSGNRRYLRSLASAVDFVEIYIEAMNVQLPLWRRLRRRIINAYSLVAVWSKNRREPPV